VPFDRYCRRFRALYVRHVTLAHDFRHEESRRKV
jgi:hypothetical protein